MKFFSLFIKFKWWNRATCMVATIKDRVKNIDFVSVMSYLTVIIFSESVHVWSRAHKNTFTVK